MPKSCTAGVIVLRVFRKSGDDILRLHGVSLKGVAWLQVKAPPGSASHQIWQAVRASSAAPYYLDDFKCGNDRSATPHRPGSHAFPGGALL